MPHKEQTIIYINSLFNQSWEKLESLTAGHYSTRDELITAIIKNADQLYATGIVDIFNKYAFLRYPSNNFLSSSFDIYIDLKALGLTLKHGDIVTLQVSIQKQGGSLGLFAKKIVERNFSHDVTHTQRGFLTYEATHPTKLLNLEDHSLASLFSGYSPISSRLVSIFAPIGYGQRVLLVSPPKAGKTSLLLNLSLNCAANPNDIIVILLINERPEEVDLFKSVLGDLQNVFIFYSSFDMNNKEHIKTAELSIEFCMRYVEAGHNVILFIDSLTRLARAYNAYNGGGGKLLSGGIDPASLSYCRKIFAYARCLKNYSSLTIFATCLIDTVSKMDNLIFEELKSTGNSEIVLDRRLAEKHIYPCIDISRTSTRNDNILLNDDNTLHIVRTIRNYLHEFNIEEGLTLFIKYMKRFANNSEMLLHLISKSTFTLG